MPKNSQEYKLTIENRLTRVETRVNEIADNHLPHIEAKIDRIHWLIITTAISLATGLGYLILKLQ